MMIADPTLIFREAALKGENSEKNPSIKRAQGRPARGDTEVGKQKIVEGMREALRSLGNTNITRKDVASFAGVTPALVTYYFPERSDLIKSATLPVVETVVNDVKACLTENCATKQQLIQAIDILRERYARDAVIIELFRLHRFGEVIIPDLLRDLETTIEMFFQRWIAQNNSVYDAALLQKVMMGACKSTADLKKVEINKYLHDSRCSDVAEMICSMLLGSDSETWAHVASPLHQPTHAIS